MDFESNHQMPLAIPIISNDYLQFHKINPFDVLIWYFVQRKIYPHQLKIPFFLWKSIGFVVKKSIEIVCIVLMIEREQTNF